MADLYTIKVACGSNHTLALTSDNQIFSWGSGLNGRLGNQIGTEIECAVPTKLALTDEIRKQKFIDIAAGPF